MTALILQLSYLGEVLNHVSHTSLPFLSCINGWSFDKPNKQLKILSRVKTGSSALLGPWGLN
jgi:hypothetical protein